MKCVFITGTDTDAGKTHVGCLLVREAVERGLRVGVYKPVASGCIPGVETGLPEVAGCKLVAEDAARLWLAAGKPLDLDAVCPQKFLAALAPNVAARREGKVVDRDRLVSGLDRWRDFELVFVEGAGGLLSPLADRFLNLDFAKQLRGASIQLVAPNRLGVIHQVLSTIHAAQAAGVTIEKLYLSQVDKNADPSIADNAGQIREFLPTLEIREIGWEGHAEH